MPRSEDRYEPYDERVSSEPQRRALDAMSEDLVRKLHAMVAEQEARARAFAATQHSLSSLPKLQPLPEQRFPEQHASTPQMTPAQVTTTHRSTISNGPRISQYQKQKKAARANAGTPADWDTQFDNIPAPTPAQPSKEKGCGAGTIITCIIIFLIILRSCS